MTGAKQLGHHLLAIVEEFERDGHVDIRSWLQQLPEHAAYLTEFVFELEFSGGVPAVDQSAEGWQDVLGAHTDVFEQHSRASPYEEVALGKALASAAALPPAVRDTKHEFRRAAVHAWAFDIVRCGQPTATAYSTGKAVYLLEECLHLGLFEEHRQMTYGPFDPALKYKGAPKIARQQRWYSVEDGGRLLRAADNLEGAAAYAERYVKDRDTARQFLRYVSRLSFSDLEAFATTIWACRAIEQRGEPCAGAVVLEWLGKNWPEKVDRPVFDLATVDTWLARARRLGFIRAEGTGEKP